MNRLKEDLYLAHGIGLISSALLGLFLLLLSASGPSAGWLKAVCLMYLVIAGLSAAAPYTIGEEMMAAAAAAMAGLSRRAPFLRRPAAIFRRLPRAAMAPRPRLWRSGRSERPRRRTRPALVVKTATPFRLFRQAPLRIP